MEDAFYRIMYMLVSMWFEPPLFQITIFVMSIMAALTALKLTLAREWGLDEFFASQDDFDSESDVRDYWESDDDMMDAILTNWYDRRRGEYGYD
jgi:hypothetical protein